MISSSVVSAVIAVSAEEAPPEYQYPVAPINTAGSKPRHLVPVTIDCVSIRCLCDLDSATDFGSLGAGFQSSDGGIGIVDWVAARPAVHRQ